MEDFLSSENSSGLATLVTEDSTHPYGLNNIAQALSAVGSSNTFLVTNTHDSGEGSLREAIQMANASEGRGLVVLSHDLTGAIKLNTEIVITESVNIEGNGNKLRGAGEDRLLRIDDGDVETWSSVEIHDLILTGGVADGTEASAAAGGAIYSAEALTLNEVVVRKNFASRFGAGIFNFQGQLTVKDSLISQNDDIAAEEGTFYGIYGGGIYNYRGTVNIVDSIIRSQNVERCGGGVFNESGTVVIEGTAIKRNTALHGGAVLNLNGDVVFLDGTKLVRNTAQELGGAVANFATLSPFAGPFGRTEAGGEFESAAPAVLIMDSDSVIRKNTAGDFGGGIFNGDDEGFFTAGTLIGVKEGINVLKNKKEDIFGPSQKP